MNASDLGSWLLVWVVTFVLNVIPAFMPPTWSALAYFHFREDLSIVPLAAVGATAAAGGRAVLALASRALGPRMVPTAWRKNIETLVATLRARKAVGLPTLALFSLSPIPSNHLFIAAGLANAPLLPILAAFLVGRFINYIIWIGAANSAANSLGDVLSSGGTNWTAILSQVGGFVVLVVVMRLDWARILARWVPVEDAGLDTSGAPALARETSVNS